MDREDWENIYYPFGLWVPLVGLIYLITDFDSFLGAVFLSAVIFHFFLFHKMVHSSVTKQGVGKDAED